MPEENNNEESSLIKDLRKQLEAANKQLQTFSEQNRTTEIGKFLSSKGVKPSIAKYIPDSVKAEDVDAINKWLTDNADDFGLDVSNVETPNTNQQPSQDVQAQQRIADVQQAAHSSSSADTLEARVLAAKTDAEVNAILKEAGANVNYS